MLYHLYRSIGYRRVKIVTNGKGLNILSRLDGLDVKLEKSNPKLKETRAELGTVTIMVHDMREREYVTFLRNYCEGFGASRYAHAKRTPLQIEVNRRVNALNTGRIHVGNAAADAAMFLFKKPFNSDTAFRHLYSLAPAEIHEICRSSWALFLESLLTRLLKLQLSLDITISFVSWTRPVPCTIRDATRSKGSRLFST